MITSDPRITGNLSDSDLSGFIYQLQVDLDGDGSVDDWQWAHTNHSFQYTPPLDLPAGPNSIAVRGVEYDSSYGNPTIGDWETVSFEFDPQPSGSGSGSGSGYHSGSGAISWALTDENPSNGSGESSNSGNSEVSIDFYQDQLAPPVKLPNLGQIPDDSGPEINHSFYLEGIPRTPFSNSSPSPDSSSSTRSWTDPFGSYTETISLLTTVDRVGTSANFGGDWALSETLTSTWSIITTFTDSQGEEWSLTQTGSKSHTFSGWVDYTTDSVTIAWSLSSSLGDNYLFTRLVESSVIDPVSADETSNDVSDIRSGTQSYTLTAAMQRTESSLDGSLSSFYSTYDYSSQQAEFYQLEATRLVAANSELSTATTLSSAEGVADWQFDLSYLEDWSLVATDQVVSNFQYESASADYSSTNEVIDWDETVLSTSSEGTGSGSGGGSGSNSALVIVDLSTRTVRTRQLENESNSNFELSYSGSFTRSNAFGEGTVDSSYTAAGSSYESFSDEDDFRTIITASTSNSEITVDTHRIASESIQSAETIVDAWGNRIGQAGSANYQTSASGSSSSSVSITVITDSADTSTSGIASYFNSDNASLDSSSANWNEISQESETIIEDERISTWSYTSAESGNSEATAQSSSGEVVTSTLLPGQISSKEITITSSLASSQEWELSSSGTGTETRLIDPGASGGPWESTETTGYSEIRSGVETETSSELITFLLTSATSQPIPLTLFQRDRKQQGNSHSWVSELTGLSTTTSSQIAFDSDESGLIEDGEWKYVSTTSSEDHDDYLVLNGTTWWSNENTFEQTVRLLPVTTKSIETWTGNYSEDSGAGTWTEHRGNDSAYESTYVSITEDHWENSTELETEGSSASSSHAWNVTAASGSGSYERGFGTTTTVIDFPSPHKAVKSITSSEETQSDGELTYVSLTEVHSYEYEDGTSLVTELSTSETVRTHDLEVSETTEIHLVDRTRASVKGYSRSSLQKSGTRTITALESRSLSITGTPISESETNGGSGSGSGSGFGSGGGTGFSGWGYSGILEPLVAVVEEGGIRYVTTGTAISSLSDLEETEILSNQFSTKFSSYTSLNGGSPSTTNPFDLDLPDWLEALPVWTPDWPEGGGSGEGSGSGGGSGSSGNYYEDLSQQTSSAYSEGIESRADGYSQTFTFLGTLGVLAEQVSEQSLATSLESEQSLDHQARTMTKGTGWTHFKTISETDDSTSTSQIATTQREESKIFADGKFWGRATFRDEAEVTSSYSTSIDHLTVNRDYTSFQASSSGTSHQHRISETDEAKGWGVPITTPESTTSTWFDIKIVYESVDETTSSSDHQLYNYVFGETTGGYGREAISGNSFSLGITMETNGTQEVEEIAWSRDVTGSIDTPSNSVNSVENYGRLILESTNDIETEIGLSVSFATNDTAGSLDFEITSTQNHSQMTDNIWENGVNIQKDYTDSINFADETYFNITLRGDTFSVDIDYISVNGFIREKEGDLSGENVHGIIVMSNENTMDLSVWSDYWSWSILDSSFYSSTVGNYEFTRTPGWLNWVPYEYGRETTRSHSTIINDNGNVQSTSSGETWTEILNPLGRVSVTYDNGQGSGSGSGSGGPVTYENNFAGTLPTQRVDQQTSLVDMSSLLYDLLDRYNYDLGRIPYGGGNIIHDGISQWSNMSNSGSGSGQNEFELREQGYASDGTYFQHYVNDSTSAWYTTYYTADPNQYGQFIRSESGQAPVGPSGAIWKGGSPVHPEYQTLSPHRYQSIPPAGQRPGYGEHIPEDPANWNPELDDHIERDRLEQTRDAWDRFAFAGGDPEAFWSLPQHVYARPPKIQVTQTDSDDNPVGTIVADSDHIQREVDGELISVPTRDVYLEIILRGGEPTDWDQWFRDQRSRQLSNSDDAMPGDEELSLLQQRFIIGCPMGIRSLDRHLLLPDPQTDPFRLHLLQQDKRLQKEQLWQQIRLNPTTIKAGAGVQMSQVDIDPFGIIVAQINSGTTAGVSSGKTPLKPEMIFALQDLFPIMQGETIDQWLDKLGFQLDGSRKEAYLAVILSKMEITPDQLKSYDRFTLENRQIMQKIYGYYESVFQQNPDLLWAGMAKLAGNTVWNGLSLGQDLGRLAPGPVAGRLGVEMEQQMMRMNLDIFNDLAWVHEAYLRGGIEEIRSLAAMGEIHGEVLKGFELIDQGRKLGDTAIIKQGNLQLLRREQREILEPGYGTISRYGVKGILRIMSANPIPGGRPFWESVPRGDLTDFDDRWKWITTDMLPQWERMSAETRQILVSMPLGSTSEDLFNALRFHAFRDLLGR